ncbi:hypothetical protein BDR22DRAFT_971347 [Usnea florida]
MAHCSISSTCDSHRTMHVAVVSVFAFLALVSVILRVWARKIKKTSLELSDYLCFGGLIFALASTLVSIQSYVHWGFFSRSIAGDSDLVTVQFKALLVGQLLWIAAVTLIRASVIFLYIYIFCIKAFRLACYGVLTINLAYFTATVLACCLICRPFAFNWDQSLHGTCGDQKSLDLFIGVFNLLMDIVTVALPMPVLWGLQMPVGRKVAISGLFALGTTICIITVVRIKVTTDITAENTAGQYALISVLTCLEQSLGVVNACLPITKPVFKEMRPMSLIGALSGWTSSRKGTPSEVFEDSAKQRQVGWPLQEHTKVIAQRESQESRLNVGGAVWSPLSSPRDDIER